ncbi:caspase family protein [Sulfurimonas sp.]|uniref:caspase family protein n=1 Tax=Sulfurimonas sp. TaxID=2022749 RepID=UPI003D0F7003
MKIKNSLALCMVGLMIGGCATKPKLNAYVPPKQDVVVQEKIVYQDRVVAEEKIVYVNEGANLKETLQEEYEKVKSEYAFTTTQKKNQNSFALVIGINKYKQNTPVEFADLSAMAFEELAQKTLGVPKENIITLLNDEATSGQLKAKIETIKELADKNGNIYLYFAGHGVPGKDGSTYILPNDMSADAIHLEANLKLDNIYDNLSKSNAKNVFVFMDSCFSGKDDSGGLLYKGVAPVLKTNEVVLSQEKLTVMTAGSSTDFANDYAQKKQRLFSYYLIQELASGKSDLSEVYENIKNKVKKTSLMKGLGYKQVPQIYGKADVALLY